MGSQCFTAGFCYSTVGNIFTSLLSFCLVVYPLPQIIHRQIYEINTFPTLHLSTFFYFNCSQITQALVILWSLVVSHLLVKNWNSIIKKERKCKINVRNWRITDQLRQPSLVNSD